MRRAPLSALLALLALATACSAEATTKPAAVTVPMTIGKQVYNLEIAADNDTRSLGLMHRESMPEDHGMIFIFAKEEQWSFWMKNTLIPLDLIYVAASGKIVDIATLQPKDETGYQPRENALYVIELNAGQAKKLGIKPGDKLTLPEKLPAAK